MRLNALLMCRDQQALRLLTSALEELEIEQEVCLAAPDAIELLVQNHYSAIVLDFEVSGAAQVARLARAVPPKHRPVVFAMLGGLSDIGATFQAGANFVLYKPLNAEQIMRSLRAGRGFMQADRRRSPRLKLETIIYLQYGIAALPALMLDLNEQGLSLQAGEPLPAIQQVPLRFVLPGTNQMVEGTGEMIWADDSGRAGMLFVEMPTQSRKLLQAWLRKRAAKKRPARTSLQSRSGRARHAAAQ